MLAAGAFEGSAELGWVEGQGVLDWVEAAVLALIRSEPVVEWEALAGWLEPVVEWEELAGESEPARPMLACEPKDHSHTEDTDPESDRPVADNWGNYNSCFNTPLKDS